MNLLYTGIDMSTQQLPPLKDHLQSRHLIHQYTHEELFEQFQEWGKNFYFGVDCSADSMHIGHFAALMLALNIMSYGNKCYLIVGWATSTIGNPSWKDNERPVLTSEQLAHNEAWIHAQFERLCSNVAEVTGKRFEYEVINNKTFFEWFNTLDFLREVGRYVTVNRMLTKDIVRKRVSDPDKSISYAEFSYMLLMGDDYYKLYTEHDVTLQVWWSDEWDGMLSGMEIIRKKLWRADDENPVGAITLPLVLDSTGKKFGKSEGNAIWLSPERNSPYVVYNYLMNAADEDVERYLRLFTFKSDEEIKQIIDTHTQAPHLRQWQQTLAFSAVQMIFWTQAANQCEEVRQVLFAKGDIREKVVALSPEWVAMLWASTKLCRLFPEREMPTIIEALTSLDLVSSNGDAKKALKEWCVWIYDKKITDMQYRLLPEDFSENGVALLKKGKKSVGILVSFE